MYLELRKKTVDKFTADEFNQIVAAINAKVEQEAGKSLSDENFTAEEKAFLTTLATQNVVKMITDEVARATGVESTLSGKLDELSKVALADVGYFAIEYGDEEDSSQADPAVTIINQPYYDYFMAKWEAANKPCEKKLDGTDFAYLQDDVTLRADGSASHLEDANYFQGAEMINFNISYF